MSPRPPLPRKVGGCHDPPAPMGAPPLIKHFSVCCLYASIYNGCRDIGTQIFEMVKIRFFFELFGPPCGNPLANLDGSMPECAQVCALHTRPHLTTLRKRETVDGSVALGVIRKTGITSLNFWLTL